MSQLPSPAAGDRVEASFAPREGVIKEASLRKIVVLWTDGQTDILTPTEWDLCADPADNGWRLP